MRWHLQLPTFVREPPRGPGWIHEVKYDGYRLGAEIKSGRVRLTTRGGADWTGQYPQVAAALAALPVASAVLDGEVAVVLPDGRTSFQDLQNGGRGHAVVYIAFDLLAQDGEDLRALPLVERKARLARLLAGGRLVQCAPHVEGDSAAIWEAARRAGWEGIVSKRRDSRYLGGRSPAWLKAKCRHRQEFVVAGFTDPEGSREGIGALVLGYFEGGALRYAGKVGTGFTTATANELRALLEQLAQADCPLAPAPPERAHWVRPVMLVEVEFGAWTEGGHLRHPAFKGLRKDKRAEEVVRERATAA